jgi:hypothetical protein
MEKHSYLATQKGISLIYEDGTVYLFRFSVISQVWDLYVFQIDKLKPTLIPSVNEYKLD